MGAVNVAAAHMDRRGHDLFRGQAFHQQANRRHVRDGVHGPHLVEVDLLHGFAMGLALRLGDQLIHPKRVPADFFRHRQPGEDLFHILQAGVMMGVVMLMVVLVLMLVGVVMLMGVAVFVVVQGDLLRSVHQNGHVGAKNTALGGLISPEGHLGQAQSVQLPDKGCGVLDQLYLRQRPCLNPNTIVSCGFLRAG